MNTRRLLAFALLVALALTFAFPACGEGFVILPDEGNNIVGEPYVLDGAHSVTLLAVEVLDGLDSDYSLVRLYLSFTNLGNAPFLPGDSIFGSIVVADKYEYPLTASDALYLDGSGVIPAPVALSPLVACVLTYEVQLPQNALAHGTWSLGVSLAIGDDIVDFTLR